MTDKQRIQEHHEMLAAHEKSMDKMSELILRHDEHIELTRKLVDYLYLPIWRKMFTPRPQ